MAISSRHLFTHLFAAFAALFLAAPAMAAEAGLGVVVANEYEGHLPGATRDAAAVAGALEKNGFATVRLFNTPSGTIPTGLEQIRKLAPEAGPLRVVYTSGFGLCVDGDLVLLAEDAEPDQVRSGDLSDVIVPLSMLRQAASEGGEPTLVVFDGNPMQCTENDLKSIELPERTALLVTTGLDGDVIDSVEDSDNGAFATAFLKEFSADRIPGEMLTAITRQIETLSGGQQVPIVAGGL